MADAETTTSGSNEEEHDRRLELLIAIGLGFAAIVTALCVYLTDVHDDEAQIAFNEGVALTTEGGSVASQAAQQRAADEALFVEYAQLANEVAITGDRVAQESVIYIQTSLMRDELRQMVEWWADEGVKQGFETPFVDENPAFTNALQEEADALREEAAAQFADAEEEQVLGDTYIIAGVIFATALFLFGIAGVTRRIELKQRMTWAAYGVSLIAILYMVFG